MSLELTTREIGIEKIYYKGSCEESMDSDINLPDYCPDIMRILKCTAQIDITNSKLVGDRASAEGTAHINVLYSDEKNNIFCYEIEYPFSKYVEIPQHDESAALTCEGRASFIRCRAVSKRRIDLHGGINLKFNVIGIDRTKLIVSACGNGVQLKKKDVKISNAVACAGKSFLISDVADIGEASPDIGKVICSSAATVINETKIIKGKLLIKGEAAVSVIYCADNGENETVTVNCNLPFNEIVESGEFNENCKVKIKAAVNQLSAVPKSDNDGAYRYLNINGEISVCVTAYESTGLQIVNDAYSLFNEIDSEYSFSEIRRINSDFSERITVKQTVELASLKPKKIYCTTAGEPAYNCSFESGKVCIRGSVPVGIVIIDCDGTPIACEREAEFEYSRAIESITNSVCSADLELLGFTCCLNGEGNGEFKAEINLSAMISDNAKEKALSSLCIRDGEKKSRNPSLTVYFCDEGESLWDIAKKFNTTIEEITDENTVNSQFMDSKTMLLIPIR